jgi:mRNA interferase YafQ
LKDRERLAHSGRYDLSLLKHVMLLLIANDVPLGAEWLDPALAGAWTITVYAISAVTFC